jgi:hypothetical protein
MSIYLDIETAPLTEEEQKPFEPQFHARANLADPEKIEADIQAKREAWLDKAQLDGTRCRVCAYGYGVEVMGVPIIHISEDERTLLTELVELIDGADLVLAHNIGYDLGIIAQRCAIHDITLPRLHGKNFAYYEMKFIDTKDLWKPRAACVETSAKLDDIGLALGFPRKPGSGKDFWKWDDNKQHEYLTHDVRVIQEIGRRMF